MILVGRRSPYTSTIGINTACACVCPSYTTASMNKTTRKSLIIWDSDVRVREVPRVFLLSLPWCFLHGRSPRYHGRAKNGVLVDIAGKNDLRVIDHLTTLCASTSLLLSLFSRPEMRMRLQL
jgi:hypothetical protein